MRGEVSEPDRKLLECKLKEERVQDLNQIMKQ